MKYEWHLVHDFFKGWGYAEQSPEQRVIWHADVERLLGPGNISMDDCENLYKKLEPLLTAEPKFDIGQFTRFHIPLVKKHMPKLNPKDLAEI